MKTQRTIISLIIILSQLLSNVSTAFALPPLPSSFNGMAKVDGANVPDGTAVTAWINGVQYASTVTLTYSGDSVYSMDVPGDDPSGNQGATVVFHIGALTADQTGTWASGTNVTLNLTATSAYALNVSKSGTGSGTVTSSPAGISCGATCSYAFAASTLVTLTATATPPSTFGGWSGACTGTGTCTVTMSSVQSVTATFNPPSNQTLTVSKTGSGSGTVTSSPAGISCGATCSYAFAYNTPVTLTAAATPPSTFGGWSGACTGTGTCSVTMSSAQSVTANFVPGATASALQFNGSSQYVTFGVGNSLSSPTYTVETWFKRTGAGVGVTTGTGGITSAIPLITKGTSESETALIDINYFLGIDATSAKLIADFEEGAGGTSPSLNHPVTGTTTIVNDVWYHAAMTYDGTTLKIFLNGSQEGSVTVGQPTASATTSPTAFATSIRSNGTTIQGYFNGVMDESRIWNYARNQSEIRAAINSELTSGTGLIGRWGMNEGSGATIASSVGTFPGTLTNGPLWVTPGAPFNLTFDTTPPAVPAGLIATPGMDSVGLSWTANSESDLAGYNVYRSTASPVTKTTPINGSLLTSPAYVDSTATHGSTYYYAITAVDTSSNASALSTEAYATPTAPPAGAYGLQFDGVNDYVTFGAAPGLDVTNFTLETWFYWTGGGATANTGTGGATAYPLITKGLHESDGSNVDANYFLGITSTGNLTADFEEYGGGQNYPVTGAAVITTNTWHHAAVTYDGQTWKLYLDGELDTTLTLAAPHAPRYDSIQHAGIGTAMNSTGVTEGYFAGKIDEARIWNVVRSQAEIMGTINSEVTSGTGLIGRWGMNENTGTIITDSTAPAVNGTLTNGPVWITPGAPFNIVPPTVPAAPTLLAAIPTAGLQVDLSWTDNSTNETSFKVERSLDGTTGWTQIGMTTANVSTYSNAGLDIATQYCYRVRASNSAGDSDYSNVSCATTPGEPNNGLNFGGSNAYATFGNPASLGLTQFTIETWFKRTGTGVPVTTGQGGIANAIPLVTKGTSDVDAASNRDFNYFLGINNDTNVLIADFEEGATGASPSLNHPVSGATTIAMNTWYHAVATYDGTTWKLYLNGNLDSTLAVGQPPRSDNTSPVAMASSIKNDGTTLTAQGFFNGTLDEVRIWNYARTQAAIQGTMNSAITSPQSGLVARWALNETTGASVPSSAGTSVPGTITGTGSSWGAGAPAIVSHAPVFVSSSPSNGATGVSLPPTLTAKFSDADLDNLTVNFYGRLKNTPPGSDFTIIAIPDPQYLAASYPSIYNAQMSWVVNNKTTNNIAYAIGLGDNVDVSTNATQWTNATTAWDILTAGGVQYGIEAGNHDGAPATTTEFNTNFATRKTSQSTYGGRYGTSDYDNYYTLFQAGGMKFIAVFIEMDDTMTSVSNPVLVWADSILQANSDRRAIVVTHNLLNGGTADTFSTQGGTVYNALKANPNLFLMLGGHLDIARNRSDTYNGNTVYSLRSDYQFVDSQQSGYLRIMRFSPANNMIYVSTYSPTKPGDYPTETPNYNQFNLPYAMSSNAAYTLIGTTTAAAGTDASITWNGLAGSTEYEWYATASDASKTTTGTASGFTTASSNHAPVITEGASTAVTMSEDGVPTAFNLTLHATDADAGDTLNWSVLTPALHGAASASGTGLSRVVTYSPNANYNGADSFVVQVSDGNGGTDSITVNVTIQPVTDPLVCIDISLTTAEDTAKDVAPSCANVDGGVMTYSVVAPAAHGAASVVAGNLHYVPNLNYNGPDSFTYKANNTYVDSNTATVTVTVTAVNDAPVVTNPGTQTNFEGDAVSLQVAATDVDIPAQTLTYSATNLPNGLSINSSTGLISGTIVAPSSLFTTTVTVTDGVTPAQQTFTWNVIQPGTFASQYASATYPSGAVNASYTIPVGSNRLLVVAIASTRTAVGSQTVSVTYGGQALTLAAGDAGSTTTWNHSYLYYLKETGIAAASGKSLNVIITGGTSYQNWVYTSLFTNVDQTTPITDAKNFNSIVTTNSAVGPFSPALTIDAGDQAIEIVNLARSTAGTSGRTITTWATGWTTAGIVQSVATSGPTAQLYIRSRNVLTAASDGSQHTASNAATWDSMTAMSIKSLSATVQLSVSKTGSGTVTSAPTGIDCGATCSYNFPRNSSVTLTAAPALGSTFTGWSGACTGTGTCSVTMDAAKSVTANFNLAPTCYALTLNHTGQGSDPVATPANSTGCAAGQYVSDASISLSGAVPTSGWQISSWTGTNNNSSTASTNTVTMPASASAASVNYTVIPPTCYALTLSHTGQGSDPVATPANSAGCATGQYVSGESISLSGAVPTSGWQISSWTGTNNNSSTASTNTVTMPASSHSASVVYEFDVVAPTAISIMRSSPNPTSAFNVDFTVTFSESVNGVDKGDFTLITTGVKSAAVSEVKGSGNIYTVVVNTGSGKGTIQLNLADDDTIVDAALNPLGGSGAGNGDFSGPTYTKFQPFFSTAANDGWALESSEFSNVASTKSNIGTLRVGDDARNRQYRSLLYFNTADLPNNAVITKVIVQIVKAGVTGIDPFNTHGNLVADMKKGFFGRSSLLELTDFNAIAAPISTAGKFAPIGGNLYQLTLSSANFKYINLLGATQFRLRFTKDDNNDRNADFISFYGGDAAITNQPQLIIEYYVP